MAEESKPTEQDAVPEASGNGNATPRPQKGRRVRFWGIFAGLCLLAFVSALDVSIITTALPTIIDDIGGSEEYVWIANSFVIASSVVQPLVGQLANILGRRIPLITCVILFMLGSGIAGGAHSPAMLIAGRTVQGLGAGGIYVLLDIVCCDLVPLRQRGKYLGLMFSWSGLAAGLGPVVGGALAQKDWQWIFYLNIPVCGLALSAILLFMRVNIGAKGPHILRNKRSLLQQIDCTGNLIFIPSMIALLFGLVTGGIQHPWSSWRVIVPLVLGVVGWAAFHVQQHFFASSPSIPSRLFSNRTSAVSYLLAFLSSVLVQALMYFLPVYFQAVGHATVLRSGINFLPLAIGTLFFAVVAGIILAKTGSYRPIHAASFALSAIGFGLLTLLDADTAKVAWAIFELIASAGSGMILSVVLPAITAALPESDVASATAAYSFLRTFGAVWGVTIVSVIFNGVVNHNLYLISSPSLRSQLGNGVAYSFASQAHRIWDKMAPEVWNQVVEVYIRGLRAIWWVCLGISVVGFFAVGLEKGLALREDLDTEYGLREEKKDHTESSLPSGNNAETPRFQTPPSQQMT